MDRRLYLSKRNRVIWGVCGGLSEYLNIDVTVIRIGMILLAFANGIGILTYIIMAVIVPKEGLKTGEVMETIKENIEEISNSAGEIAEEVHSSIAESEAKLDNRSEKPGGQQHWIGIALIAAGLFFLARNFNIFWWFHWDRRLWPIVPIAIGLLLLVMTWRKRHE
jgi:phage shock protein C